MPVLTSGSVYERALPFNFVAFLRQWRLALQTMLLRPVPYQARRSGASLERNRWVTRSSLRRYKKHARLAAPLTRSEPEAAVQVEASFFGTADVGGAMQPPTRG